MALVDPAIAAAEAADAAFAQAVSAVRDKNYGLALQLFAPLAEAGAADAQFNLALLKKAGLGQPRNYVDAYYWAVLSDLGREQRAARMVSELAGNLPEPAQADVYARITNRLDAQLAEGTKSAIMKYARLHAEFLAEPDFETAYIWYSIAQALGVWGASEGTSEMASQLEPEALIAAQSKALDVFNASPFAQMALAVE